MQAAEKKNRRMQAAENPHVDCNCLHSPVDNVSDLLYPFLWWTDQKFAVKICLRLHFQSLQFSPSRSAISTNCPDLILVTSLSGMVE